MLNKLKTVFEESVNVDPEKVVPEARLAEDLDIDSLAAVELALELETAFDLTIEDEELAELKTVQDVIDLISSGK